MISSKKTNSFRKSSIVAIVLFIIFGCKITIGHSQNMVTPTSSTVIVSSDDAEEYISSGAVDFSSSDLEMIADAGGDQVVGIRFNGLNIPQCAPILSAYIQFTAKGENGNEGPCNLTIYGEDNDNALTFTNTDFDITSRPKTNTSANWLPLIWNLNYEMGPAQQTVDISAVIQEIVEREGFTSNSSIVILIEGTGLRRVYSFDEEPNNQSVPPTIHINYNPVIPDGDNDGVCDANDQCPGDEPGTPCNDNNSETYNDVITANCNCVGTPYDCPSFPANIGDSCNDGNPGTSNDVVNSNCVCLGVWDCPVLEANIGDSCDDGNAETSNDMISSNCICTGSYDCPSIPANIGDPCDDGESGTSDDMIDANCNCVGVWDCPGNTGIGYPCDDTDPNTTSDVINANCECEGLPFVCMKVDSSNDDAEEFPSGDMKLTSDDLEMAEDGDSTLIVGIKFNNIAVPQCAIIDKAHIQFTSKSSFDEPCELTIHAEAIDNAQAFTNADNNISNRITTDASVVWIPDPWEGGDSGPAQRSVDISPVIQEVINRVGFTTGNSIAIIISGTGTRRAYSFNSDQMAPPELCIEFLPDIPDSDGDGVCDANDLCDDGPEPGTPCEDGDPETPNDYIDEFCDCVGGVDCPSLGVDFGTPCDDGFPGTYDDMIDSMCVCTGIWECPDFPGGPVGFGYPCNDQDSTTLYDSVDSTCNCVGIPFVIVSVAESNDDAEEFPSGDMKLTSNDLEMAIDGDSIQKVGIRFKQLNIPPCAEINRAYIQFTAKNSTEGACNLEIFGEDVDHANTFVNEDFNISVRSRTAASVNWVPENWSSNDHTIDQQTPDLTTIVQKIFNRPNFTDTSAIAFIIEGSGVRRAYSFDENEPNEIPQLYIEYFSEIPDDDNDGTCNANDFCPGVPEPGTPCDDNNPLTYNDVFTFNCECAGIPFNCPEILANIGDPCDDGDPETPNDFIDSNCDCIGGFDCPSIMADFGDPCDDGESGTYDDIVDEDCNCVGIWDCEDLMVGIGDPCDDGDPSTLDDMIDSNCDCVGSPTLYVQIANSSDDAEEKETGQVSLTSSDLELVDDGDDNNQTVGLRFTNLNIPNGARIDTAFIQFTTDEVVDPNSCNLKIYGVDTDDAQTFVETNGDITMRPKTNAVVNWSPQEWLDDGEVDEKQRTGNLKQIIKELVNRDGFTTSSSIAFIIEGTGTRTATSFDGDEEDAPVLYIRYDLPLGVQNNPRVEKEKLLVYPVPTTENLNISFSCKSSANIPVQIMDLNGRLLFKDSRSVQSGENTIRIEQLNLENGIYFVLLYFDNAVHTAKFTIIN